jgi:hypothetical protein
LVLNLVYFNSTLAPAASSFFLNSSASFLATPPFTSFGAASTKSLASFKPKPVIALTSLITLIFFSPADAKKIENSDFSSPAGAAAPPAGAAATGAAAVTPHFSSSCLDNSAASTTVKVESSSIILFKFYFSASSF